MKEIYKIVGNQKTEKLKEEDEEEHNRLLGEYKKKHLEELAGEIEALG